MYKIKYVNCTWIKNSKYILIISYFYNNIKNVENNIQYVKKFLFKIFWSSYEKNFSLPLRKFLVENTLKEFKKKKLILQKYISNLNTINWNDIYFSETPCTHRRAVRQVFNALISICINPVLTYNVLPHTCRLFFSLLLLSFMPLRSEERVAEREWTG